MKLLTLVLVTLFVVNAFAADVFTQVIRCEKKGQNIEIQFDINNEEILYPSVEFWGEDLTPGLWRGQKLGSSGDQVFIDVYSSTNSVAFIGAGTDPSQDNPYMFEVVFSTEDIGKPFKRRNARGAIKLGYAEQAGSYSYQNAEDIAEEWEELGLREQADNRRWKKSCYSYLKY